MRKRSERRSRDRDIPALRLDPTAPFTRAEAGHAGISAESLRGPRFQRVFFDLYIGSDVPVTTTIRARAALKVSPPGSYASQVTAAELWSAWVPERADTDVCVPAGGRRTQRRGIHAHEAGSGSETTMLCGLPVSSPTQTFLDLAGVLDLVQLVVAGDSLVRSELVTCQDLIAAADGWSGRGARLGRRAARLVRPGVDSPMETRLRMLIVLSGLPEPQVNFILRDEEGHWVVRFDLCYPDLKLIIEYDGRQHAENDQQWARDIERREYLDRHGWRILVVRSAGVYVEPARTLQRVAAALRERGRRPAGKPKEEWRRFFPGRAA